MTRDGVLPKGRWCRGSLAAAVTVPSDAGSDSDAAAAARARASVYEVRLDSDSLSLGVPSDSDSDSWTWTPTSTVTPAGQFELTAQLAPQLPGSESGPNCASSRHNQTEPQAESARRRRRRGLDPKYASANVTASSRCCGGRRTIVKQ